MAQASWELVDGFNAQQIWCGRFAVYWIAVNLSRGQHNRVEPAGSVLINNLINLS